jgi:chromosome partitioning protein
MRRIAFINQKGGVGKTTSTINVGAGLANLRKRVLLIDLDPQAHLTYSLGIQANELQKSVYNVLKGEVSAGDVVTSIRTGLDVLGANLDLSGADIEFSRTTGGEFLLREALAGVRGYDFVLVDCPPSLGFLTVNALAAVDEVFIPVQTEFLALRGLAKLEDVIEVVRQRLNRKLVIGGIIKTRFDARRTLNRDVVDELDRHFPGKVFKTAIRENVALAEAPSYGEDIFNYRKRCHGAEDYAALCREILKRG